ncbi:hypothetical protein NQ176_g4688 [Zarea fungicola]|uniref:Uncharacterized protein n=1 Tax=Zarea fungicola TaxID=93591 RepID=A0ACC1NDF3_9HYPO|nr:hypothetical protein NQ176_g4688 [Lecanicillium fungicola]
MGIKGRIRILGTPAEEGGGGKAVLIRAGAFEPRDDVAAAIMAHPLPKHMTGSFSGLAAADLIATNMFRVEFRGRSAHAGGEPWSGTNALDAAVSAYNSISMLRQQIHPDERLHGIIESGGTVPNVIPDYTRMNWFARTPTTEQGNKLLARVHACIDAAATATGCSVNYIPSETYKHIIGNRTLCETYVEDMASFGDNIAIKSNQPFTVSTDMGNVSHEVPSFHGGYKRVA